jgi:hypothetical protein
MQQSALRPRLAPLMSMFVLSELEQVFWRYATQSQKHNQMKQISELVFALSLVELGVSHHRLMYQLTRQGN